VGCNLADTAYSIFSKCVPGTAGGERGFGQNALVFLI
jgi:hypothetical protein